MGGPPLEAPLILKGIEGRRQVVVALDHRAWQMGLRRGMALAKAQALIDGLTVMDFDAVADQAALDELARWALQNYSPIVASDPPYGLVLDIAGASHLFGGEDRMVSHIIGALSDMGITAYAAVADTWAAAYALVRLSGKSVSLIEAGKTIDAVLNLPISALRLPRETIEGLRDLGFDKVGELAAQPRAPMARRFGQQLWRCVDMMFGRLPELIVPIDCPELIAIKKVFHEPIGLPETIEKYLARLTVALCDQLEQRALGARRLDLRLTNTDHTVQVVTVSTAKPVRTYKTLFRLLRSKIEQIRPGIDDMSLVAVLVEPLGSIQIATSFGPDERPEISDLCDVISNRFGPERLFRVVSAATDIPERAARRLPPLSTDMGSRRNARYRRPERLLTPEPIRATALLPDKPPREFTWRDRRYRVVSAESPEVIRGEWWISDREKGKVRTYFVVEVESGQRFWVFRGGDGIHASTGSLTWYVHGVLS